MKPSDFGIIFDPDEYRQIQIEALEFALDSSRRFVAMTLPTGSGKSLIAASLVKGYAMSGSRGIVLNPIKALEDQYIREFSRSGFVNIRGRSNYECHEFRDCKVGPDLGCSAVRSGGCEYQMCKGVAAESRAVITNYAYWLNSNQYGKEGLVSDLSGPFGLLVLDEAHLAEQEVSRFLEVHVTQRGLEDIGIWESMKSRGMQSAGDVRWWMEFAREVQVPLELKIQEVKVQCITKPGDGRWLRLFNALTKFQSGMSRIASINDEYVENWIVSDGEGRSGLSWQIAPLIPAQFAESVLFRGVEKVILISATMTAKVLRDLGIKEKEVETKRWAPVFKRSRYPVYFAPGIRVGYKAGEHELLEWVRGIDAVIEARLDRKGIIHTVSYARQKFILEHSRFKHLMIGNTGEPGSERAEELVREFKGMDAPALFVSPSLGTGWDFPGRECEYQIIGKLPIPDMSSKLMKERKKRDKQFMNHVTMQSLEQACGRGMRHEKDRCETFILDGNLAWFLPQSKHLGSGNLQVIWLEDKGGLENTVKQVKPAERVL